MRGTITFTHRIEVCTTDLTVMESYPWNSKRYGNAAPENLEAWRVGMNASFQPGGVNEHISEARGVIPCIVSAKLIHQHTGEMVAEVGMEMPEFVAP